MKQLKDGLFIAFIVDLMLIPFAVFLAENIFAIFDLIFSSAFFLGLIATLAYNRRAKEYYLDHHKSMYKEKEDKEILDVLNTVKRWSFAGLINLSIYFIYFLIQLVF